MVGSLAVEGEKLLTAFCFGLASVLVSLMVSGWWLLMGLVAVVNSIRHP